MLKKILNLLNVRRKKEDVEKEVVVEKKEASAREIQEYKDFLDTIRAEIVRLESLEEDFDIVKSMQTLKAMLVIPNEYLKAMDANDICFYVLNSDSFKSFAENTETVTADVVEILNKLTQENVAFKFSMEDSINLLYFYGNLLSDDGIKNLVYSIIDKCHGDLGVYTTIVKNLAELNKIEAVEIVYSAISFKYGEEVAKKLMVACGLEVDFSKVNKII